MAGINSYVSFTEYHTPSTHPGDYKISVTRKMNPGEQDSDQVVVDKQLSLKVRGPRFSLAPEEVFSVYPAKGATIEDYAVLPHILFNRTTVPWERSPKVSKSSSDKHPLPWLALLLLYEDEMDKDTLVSQPWKKAFELLNLPLTEHENSDMPEMISILSLNNSLFDQLLPAAEDLSLLSHVRKTAAIDTSSELAALTCNRLPDPSKRANVYLVSLHDYDRGAEKTHLVSLFNWSFSCAKSTNYANQAKMDRIFSPQSDTDHSQSHLLRIPNTGWKKSLIFHRQGFVALPYRLREGKQTVSWYRGPLSPFKTPAEDFDFPISFSDDLISVNKESSMLNVSYASAWNLGRSLGLANKSFASSLLRWKRTHLRYKNNAEEGMEHLPFTIEKPDPAFPSTVELFLSRLALLVDVPVKYLVPDERMLPAESMRFFHIDANWIKCLLDGALSIGRGAFPRISDALHLDIQRDQVVWESTGINRWVRDNAKTLCGFLLRSELVSAWPNLVISTRGTASLKSGHPEIVRKTKLSKNILLCISGHERLQSVDFSQRADTVHYGFSVLDNKFVISSPDLKTRVEASSFIDNATNTLQIDKLCKEIALRLKDRSRSSRNAATVASYLMAKVPHWQIRFITPAYENIYTAGYASVLR